jgi:hypothetical protein
MTNQDREENVVSGLYDNYNETQREILAIETKKTRNKLISIAIVIFALDLIALMMINRVMSETLLMIIIVPVVILALAFLSIKEPMVAMIIAAVIIVGLWVVAVINTGGMAAISGWLGKAVIIYLLIAGFQNAREAQRIKKELEI